MNWSKAGLGMDVSPQQCSTYKSNLKAKGGTSGKKKGHAPAGGPGVVGNGQVAIEDLEAVKAIVARVGAEQVKRMAGLFE